MLVGIYARRSKEDESNSIANQIREGEEFATKKGFKSKTYNEGSGLSGGLTLSDRPKLKELFDDVKAGIITAVWMRNQERLERNTEVFFQFSELAIQYDLTVYLGGTKFDYTNPSNFLSGGIISMVNTYTRKKQSKDTRKSIKDNYKAGLTHGTPNYGYMKEDVTRKMIQHPEHAENVKLIFKLSLEGNGFNTIADELNKRNIPTRYNELADRLKLQPDYDVDRYNSYKNKKWVGGSIQNIINNEIYKGVRTTKHGEVYHLDNPILESFYYDKVVRHLKENMNNSGKKVEHKYLLNGSCTCGVCGKAFTGRIIKVGKNYHYYQCVTKKHGKNSCGNLRVRRHVLDNLIWDIYFKNKRMLDILDVDFNAKGVMKQILDITKNLKELNDSKETIEEQKELVIDAVLAGTLKQHQIQSRMDKLDKQQSEIDEAMFDGKQELLKCTDTLQNSIDRNENFDDVDSITTLEDKQTMIQKHIKNMTITKTGKQHTLIEFEYTAPNVFPDKLVIDRLYNWYALPHMMKVESLTDKKLSPDKELEILKAIQKDFNI